SSNAESRSPRLLPAPRVGTSSFLDSGGLRQLVFEGREPRAKSGVLQRSVSIGWAMTESPKQCALIGVEIGAGGMWPIERDGEAAGSARDWNGKNGSPEPRRQLGVINIVITDIERFSQRQRRQHGVVVAQRSRRAGGPTIGALVTAKDTPDPTECRRRSQPEDADRLVGEQSIDSCRGSCLCDRLLELRLHPVE